jgi:hypothetical protein
MMLKQIEFCVWVETHSGVILLQRHSVATTGGRALLLNEIIQNVSGVTNRILPKPSEIIIPSPSKTGEDAYPRITISGSKSRRKRRNSNR